MGGIFNKKPEKIDSRTFATGLLTFRSLAAADDFVNAVFPQVNYEDKFNMLCHYYNFAMVGGYVPDGQDAEKQAEENYYFTLQHLIDKAMRVGIENVIRKETVAEEVSVG